MGEVMSRRPYTQELPKTTWYLRQGRYMRYMAREVTCIFIGAYTFLLLWGIKRLSEGPEAYAAFLDALQSPISVIFQLITLIFAVYHAASWFNLTPKAMPIQRGEAFVPGGVIVGVHYAGWAVLSIIILLLAGVF